MIAALLTGAVVIDRLAGTNVAAVGVVIVGWLCVELGGPGSWFGREEAAPVQRDPRWCVGCGYDLSGLPEDSAVCPECGRARG